MGKNIGVTFEIGAKTMSTVASTFATVESRISNLKQSAKELQTFQTKAAALTTATARLEDKKAAYAATPTAALKKELDAAQKAFNSAERSAGKYNITVANSAKVQAQTTAAIHKTEAALARQEKLFENQAKRRELHGQLLGTVGMVSTVAAPVKLAIDFESSFADVKKVIDFASAEEEKAIQADIRDLSAKTGLAASGIAGIYAAAGSAKLATSREELLAFADTAATMAVAFGMTADEAGAKMASWRSKMGMSQTEVVALSDAINHLGNNMAADPLKTATVVERMGAVAKAAGLSEKGIAALSASFVAASPSPEIAATGMKNFLLAMTKGEALTAGQKGALDQLGFGDPAQLAAAMQKDAEGTIMQVMESIKNIPKEEQGAILATLFGSESLGAIQPLLENLDTLKTAFRAVADEQSFAGSMSKEYASRSKTTENALSRLRRAGESLGIALGSTLLPAIATVADTTVKLIAPVIRLAEEYPQVTAAIFGVVSGLAAFKVVGFAGSYAATILSDGLVMAKGAFGLVRGAVVVLIPAVKAFSAALMANPVGLVITAVVALGAGLYYLYKNCEPVRNAINKVWEVVKAVGRQVLPVLLFPFVAAWEGIKMAWEPAKAFFGLLWNGIKTVARIYWTVISTTVTTVWSAIKTVWNGTVSFFSTLWEAIKAPAIALWETVAAAATWCVNLFRPLWEPVVTVFAGVWEGIKAPAVAVFDWIGAKFDWVAGKFQWLYDTWAKVNGWFSDDESELTVAQAETKVKAAETVAARPTVVAEAARSFVPQSVSVPAASFSTTQTVVQGTPAVAVPSYDQLTMPKYEAPAPQIQAPVTQEFNITLHGVPDKEFAQRVVEAIKSQRAALQEPIAKIVADIMSHQKRLAYD